MNLSDLIKLGIKDIEDFQEGRKTCYKTGIQILDEYVPIHSGTHFICARPGQGKTHLVHRIFLNCIEKYKTAYFYAEDSSENTAKRLLSYFTPSFRPKDIYKTKMNESQWRDIMHAAGKLTNPAIAKNAYVEYSGNWNIERVIAKMKQLAERGCQVFIYDYLQRIHAEGDIFSRHTQISEKLTSFFETGNIALIGVLQLGRSGDKTNNPNSFPGLADVFGSGSYEKDAHSISMIQKYMIQDESDPTGWKESNGFAFMIRKNRPGEITKSFVIDKNYNETTLDKLKENQSTFQNKYSDKRNYYK